MDTAEANKFINALVKNLQALCHGHVSFNNSIQVIGHLYLNVDSDVNIDYIVNEKVSKNDTSSTVFVSKSYHSEPKDDKKQLANTNLQKQNQRNIPASPPYHHGNLNTDKMKNQRRRFEPGLEIRNINPAYREDKFSGYQDSGSPQKFPRMSMGGRDKQRLPKTVVETKVVPHRNETVNVIDLCDIKDEPGTESAQEQYNTSGLQQEFDMSHGEGTSQDSFSEQFPTDSMSPTPIALHLNQNFSQFQDPNNSSSSSPYGGVTDSQISQDPNYKIVKTNDIEKFMCKHCGIISNYKGNIQRHVKEKHTLIRCAKCSKLFAQTRLKQALNDTMCTACQEPENRSIVRELIKDM